MTCVVVCVPSFRRPKGLAKLLDALANLVTSAKVSVLVADNDAENHEAADLCAKLRDTYRWKLDSIVVAERGIANVRNALVARALENHPAQFIAMLDDDEWPDSRWLAEFLRVQATTNADALQGAIRRVFETPPGTWTAQCEGVSDITAPTGFIGELIGAGNILIRREALERMGAPWFDKGFALSGGEDADFFMRLKIQGARFAWANDAVAYELVPASRSNLKWVLSRAYSIGNSDMRVFLKSKPRLSARALEASRIAGVLLLYPIAFAILAADPNRRVRPLRKLYRAAGKLAAIRGHSHQEYSVVHGQ
jgi:GT2 family glycosyltransferase